MLTINIFQLFTTKSLPQGKVELSSRTVGVDLDMHAYDVNRKERFQRKQMLLVNHQCLCSTTQLILIVAFCTNEEQTQ